MGKTRLVPSTWLPTRDEMEPGTFKDRLLLEGDPHQLIEGMIIAAYRDRHRCRLRISARRIQAGRAAGLEGDSRKPTRRSYFGRNILGSSYSLEMHLHVSAGRYMCGEETGMLNALEGKRANPRSKPPFPTVSGLVGQADDDQQCRNAV